jgi:cytochrome c peroxidase
LSKTLYILWGATLLVAAAFAVPRLMPASPPVVAAAPGPAPAAVAPAASPADAQDMRLALEPIRPLPTVLPLDARKVALGRRLFHESRLSRDGKVSCASCHSLDTGGVDRKTVSTGVDGAAGERNSPTVLNSGFNFKQFWDGRADSLEQQIDGPITSPTEMAVTWEEVLATLGADAPYVGEFRTIYADGVTEKNVRDAIATFERSLITPNSRFDRWLRGEQGAMTADELRGYTLFKEVGCTSCHQGINVGGTMFQTLGRMADYFGLHGGSAKDLGRFKITGREEDRYRFKVPSLRNVALTPPYLHDGSVPTLDEAVKLMGHYQLGVDLPDADVKDLVKFLHSLTGNYEAR